MMLIFDDFSNNLYSQIFQISYIFLLFFYSFRPNFNMPPPGRSAPNETAIEMKRSPCVVCKRKFPEDRLKTHEDICRHLKQKRPVYNATAHRLNGVATEQEIKKIIREKTKPTVGTVEYSVDSIL